MTNLYPRTVAIIQARMASSRLPGKVLRNISGQPVLGWVVERTKRARLIDAVGVATTINDSDDPIVDFCQVRGYPVYRGDEFDVLDRYYQAALFFQAEVIVRITADCPLIDWDVIDQTVRQFFEHGVDFAANRLPPPWKRTYPIGLDTEVCTISALERAWREAKEPFEREHVMPYLYDQEGRFKVLIVNHEPDYGALRWTVDTAEDLEVIRRVAAHFKGRNDFGWLEVLKFFEQHPELAKINAEVAHKTATDVDERLMKP